VGPAFLGQSADKAIQPLPVRDGWAHLGRNEFAFPVDVTIQGLRRRGRSAELTFYLMAPLLPALVKIGAVLMVASLGIWRSTSKAVFCPWNRISPRW